MLTWITALGLLLALTGCSGAPDPQQEAREWLDRGLTQFQSQQYDQAIVSLSRAVALAPHHAGAHNLLGVVYRFKYYQVRDPDLKKKEMAAYQKALEADPKYWPAHLNLGAAYYYEGDKATAARFFRQALELQPEHPDKDQLLEMIAEGEVPGE